LKRADIDTSIKDFEGYTAYDLYNSTVTSAQPTQDEVVVAELFTWGTNRRVGVSRNMLNMSQWAFPLAEMQRWVSGMEMIGHIPIRSSFLVGIM
jgi:hypothetical protein